MQEIDAPEIRRLGQFHQLFLLRLHDVGGPHRLLDSLAHGDLLDVIHVATGLPEVGLAVLDLLRVLGEACIVFPQHVLDARLEILKPCTFFDLCGSHTRRCFPLRPAYSVTIE